MYKVLKSLPVVIVLSGCASSAPAPDRTAAGESPAAAQELAGKNFFTGISQKMTPEQVMAAIGTPSRISSGQSGKQWIPFYFGPDNSRVYWSYKGVGLVVFSKNSYNGSLTVVETRYDAAAQ